MATERLVPGRTFPGAIREVCWQAGVMTNEDGRRGDALRAGHPAARGWREMLGEFPAIRQVFHALCAMDEGEDATELLTSAREPGSGLGLRELPSTQRPSSCTQ